MIVVKSYRISLVLCALLVISLLSLAQRVFAENIQYPADAGVIDVTKAPYLADPTGAVDATAAIQKAITDARGNLRARTIYFPNGTYKVSDTLIMGTDKDAHRGMILQGQSRNGAVIKLINNAPGYGNSAQPKVLINSSRSKDNWANSNFNLSVMNMTLDVGAGNPGAVGLVYIASNEGTVRDVLIQSSDPAGAGYIGFDESLEKIPGPAFIKRLEVRGFDYGIKTASQQYSTTMEDVTLKQQHIAGIYNASHTLNIRKLNSINSVPAIVQAEDSLAQLPDGQYAMEGPGMISLIDSQLTGGSSAVPAVDIRSGHLFARQVLTSGYKSVIKDHGVEVAATGNVDEYVTGGIVHATSFQKNSLNLEIKETPEPAWPDPATWVSVRTYGAKADSLTDNTAAIQAAMNSGAETIYFPNTSADEASARYNVSDTITIPAKVKRIVGMFSILTPTGTLKTTVGKPMFKLEDGPHEIVLIEGLRTTVNNVHSYFIENKRNKTLVMRDMAIRAGYAYRNSGTGDLYLENFHTLANFNPPIANPEPGLIFKNQNVWARQFNPEVSSPEVINEGSRLWILGMKTEYETTLIETRDSGKTELIGCLSATVKSTGKAPAFITTDSEFSAAGCSETRNTASNGVFEWIAQENRNGVTRNVYANDVPFHRAAQDPSARAFAIPLYTAYGPMDILKEIKVDGIPVTFNGESHLTVTLPSGTTNVPTVVGIAADPAAQVHVYPAASVPGLTLISVQGTGADATLRWYQVKFVTKDDVFATWIDEADNDDQVYSKSANMVNTPVDSRRVYGDLFRWVSDGKQAGNANLVYRAPKGTIERVQVETYELISSAAASGLRMSVAKDGTSYQPLAVQRRVLSVTEGMSRVLYTATAPSVTESTYLGLNWYAEQTEGMPRMQIGRVSFDYDVDAVVLSPAANQVYLDPAHVDFSIYTSDSSGIKNIEIYAGSTLLGEATNAGDSVYNFRWSQPPGGDYSLQVKITAGSGRIIYADPVRISVKNRIEPGAPVPIIDSSPVDGYISYVDGTNNPTNTGRLNGYLRLKPDGTFAGADGAVVKAENTLVYEANKTYKVRTQLNLGTKKYSLWVTPTGGQEVQIANNYTMNTSGWGINYVRRMVNKSNADGEFKVENHKIWSDGAPNPVTTPILYSSGSWGAGLATTDLVSTNYTYIGNVYTSYNLTPRPVEKSNSVLYDLGVVRQMNGIGVVWKNGASASNPFTVEVSTDGVNWTPVFKGKNSGKTTNEEVYHFSNVSASKVRVLNAQGVLSAVMYGYEPTLDARLQEIRVDGVSMKGFSPENTTYHVGVSPHVTAMPTVTGVTYAVYGKAAATVNAGAAVPGELNIRVVTDGGVKRTYTLHVSSTWSPGSKIEASDVTSDSVKLQWPVPVGSAPVAAYRLYQNDALLTTVTGNVYELKGLQAATTHQFRIEAMDVHGNAHGFLIGEAATLKGVPYWQQGSALTIVSPAKKTAVLQWPQAASVKPIAGYLIYRDNQVIAKVPGHVQRWETKSLDTGKSYKFGIVAVDHSGGMSEPLIGNITIK
ncbi:glycosyl hydrolase family 28-related protein [Paenibacillus swuensis]|uniref:glycosyl hydrolase family 28-related protein n=1 Tax=Paenibacillus swuensis TaxID=1178515 RepID=UPI000838000D|nr:glycosyl hydrolase family 28-related protein [Paenibacillus swuensis]